MTGILLTMSLFFSNCLLAKGKQGTNLVFASVLLLPMTPRKRHSTTCAADEEIAFVSALSCRLFKNCSRGRDSSIKVNQSESSPLTYFYFSLKKFYWLLRNYLSSTTSIVPVAAQSPLSAVCTNSPVFIIFKGENPCCHTRDPAIQRHSPRHKKVYSNQTCDDAGCCWNLDKVPLMWTVSVCVYTSPPITRP